MLDRRIRIGGRQLFARVISMRILFVLVLAVAPQLLCAEAPRVRPSGELPNDRRLGDLQTLNGYFPFKSIDGVDQWKIRQAEIRRRILVSQGLWPMPTKAPLAAVIHGRVEREDYVIDRVYFESLPGHYVTGSLYRPKGKEGRFPAILSPHGHWNRGRFYDAGEAHVRDDIKSGGESFEVGGRYPIQARAVQLARMGCVVFLYDMTGNADSIQLGHRPDKASHLDRKSDWGFMSTQAELRLQNMMGLQTWNSIRAIDFLLELDDVDSSRIGVTGASGGGTQSMIIGAIDQRIAAAMPCVMVSTSMQGGCTCENAPLMRIDQGNIDIAAAIAPRPLGLTAADDWTVELRTKGYPDLVKLYSMLGHPERLTAVFHTRFQHNYNQVNRAAMYDFFNRHFELGLSNPITERDFVPLTLGEATVWNDAHPAPSEDKIGDAHEVQLLKLATNDSRRRIGQLIPKTKDELSDFRTVVGGAWETILGRRIDTVGEVTYSETDSTQIGDLVQSVGLVSHADAGEQFPAIRLRLPDKKQRGTLIWISDSGKNSMYRDGMLIPPVRFLAKSGYTVWSADLFGQGEFLADGKPMESQPMWYQRGDSAAWHRFAGYTYGYNHSVFVKRVHDILSLVKLANSESDDSSPVHLVGFGKVAGPLVVAARSQAGDAIDHTFADTDGFNFESITKQDDPMFVSGAVKYLDVGGLMALCAPGKLFVVGQEVNAVAKQVYQAQDATDSLVSFPDRQSLAEAAAEILFK